LFDGESAAAVALVEAVGVSFDLVTRKAVAMDDEVRSALEKLVVPDRHI
jgi:hypothetical protein